MNVKIVDATWYETQFSAVVMDENGNDKKEKTKLAIDAMSFTEAENKAIDYITGYNLTDGIITSIAIAPYKEVFIDTDSIETNYSYTVVVQTIMLADNGKEKKTKVKHLVQASSIEAARKVVISVYDKGMTDYTIKSISETNVEEIIERDNKPKTETENEEED